MRIVDYIVYLCFQTFLILDCSLHSFSFTKEAMTSMTYLTKEKSEKASNYFKWPDTQYLSSDRNRKINWTHGELQRITIEGLSPKICLSRHFTPLETSSKFSRSFNFIFSRVEVWR